MNRNIYKSIIFIFIFLIMVPVFGCSAKKPTTISSNSPAVGAISETIFPAQWEGKSRVTVLVMGLDLSDSRKGETPRGDTMILLSLDPINHTAGIMSIPRDLWVNIPNIEYNRINTAYFYGEWRAMPGGGAELARQTVEQLIGLPINYYAVIDFDVFIKFIDEIGGVKVTPFQNVKIEKFGGGNEQVLMSGKTYTLDGALALSYARERYVGDGDIDRARRQQEIIMAVKNRILKFDTISRLIIKAPILYQELLSGINTNLQLQKAIQLGILALEIKNENIKMGVIDYSMAIPQTLTDGRMILRAVPNKIRELRNNIFVNNINNVAMPSE